jgi:hypothetical protein
MSKALSAVFGLLLLAASAGAQIKGPAEIKLAVGELSESIDLTVDADEFTFKLLGNKLRGIREFSDPKTLRLSLIGYADETAWVVVSSVKGGKLQQLGTVKVIVGAGGPTPVPPKPDPPKPDPPKPDPDPSPGPLAKSKLWAVFVEETAAAVPDRASMFGPLQLRDFMERNGHAWRVVDKDVVGADGKTPKDVERFVKDSVGKALPRLYLVDEKGKVRWSGPAPAKANDVMDLMTQYQGK